jgi:predicted chitinase
MPLPLLARALLVGSAKDAADGLSSKVKGATTAPSGTIPQVLMKKSAPKKDVTQKKTAQIIEFPNRRQQQNNSVVIPKRKSDCCEDTQRLLSDIKNTSGDAAMSSKSDNLCCETSNGFLKEINTTLKSMYSLQSGQAAGLREDSLENKDKISPGLGGLIEGTKDKATSFGQLIGEIIGLTMMLSIKPIIKLFNDGVKMMSDAIGNFAKGVSDFLSGIGKWWDDTFGGGNRDEASVFDKSKVLPNNTITPLGVGQIRAKDSIKDALAEQGIKDPKAVANIMAQVKGESNFVNQEEMSYKNTDNKRIREVFGDKVKDLTDQQLTDLKKDDSKFFEKMYGSIKALGNKDPGDAYKYRGRGYIQLTGRDNYDRIGKMIGKDLVKNPELMKDPKIAAEATAAYFKEKEKKGVNLNDIDAVTAAVAPRNLKQAQADRRKLADQILIKDTQMTSKVTTIKTEGARTASIIEKPSRANTNKSVTVIKDGNQGRTGKPPPITVMSPDRGRSPIDGASQFRS